MEETSTEKTYDFKWFYIRSQRLAGYLMMSGFILRGLAPDEDCTSRNIFRFANSLPLRNRIDQYKIDSQETKKLRS